MHIHTALKLQWIILLKQHGVHICFDKLLMTGSISFINYYWLIVGLPG